MSWRLSGTYFENCNCNVTCPCAISGFSVPGDNERCIVLLAFHVDSGEIDGVDVSGLSYAVLADAPGMMAEGNWRVGLLMDAAASPEQAEALAAVASGQRGGAPAAFNPFIGELLGTGVGRDRLPRRRPEAFGADRRSRRRRDRGLRAAGASEPTRSRASRIPSARRSRPRARRARRCARSGSSSMPWARTATPSPFSWNG